jgi:transcriptional regulator with XRE-family HTH domain
MTYTESATVAPKEGSVLGMTPTQCRAGRALLDWSQPQLADAAGVSLSTIIDYERERRPMSSRAVRAIRLALENAGVMFLDGKGVQLVR